jgi:hypothetical protein
VGDGFGAYTSYSAATPFGTSGRIISGADGAVWFTPAPGPGAYIGRVTTAGTVTRFDPPLDGGQFVGQAIAAGPDGAIWYGQQRRVSRMTTPSNPSDVVAAVLPSSRSVQVGGPPATAFGVIINNSDTAMNGCGLSPTTTTPASFSFQTTDPSTNALAGTPNMRVSIPAHGVQTFVMAFTPLAPFNSTNVRVGFSCNGQPAAVSSVGINTLLLTYSAAPAPDVIAVGATPSNDGYARMPGVGAYGLFAIAATNIGAGADMTARARFLESGTPVSAVVCETNPGTGACLASPAPTVTRTIANGQNTSWTVFVLASQAVAQDPARFRVIFELVDSSGVVRGATSVAVTTAP